MKALFVALILVLSPLGAASILAQEQHPPASQMTSRTSGRFDLDRDVPYFATIFAGGGAYSAAGTQADSTQFGFEAGAEQFGRRRFGQLGALGPLIDRNHPTAFTGFDIGPMLWLKPHDLLYAPAGYSYVFAEGHSIDYGLGWSHHYKTYRAISVEIRDYYIFTQTHQQNIALRVGWQFVMHDP